MSIEMNFAAVGTLKTYSEPANFAETMRQGMLSLGWGVVGVYPKNKVNYNESGQWLRILSPLALVALPTWNYAIGVTVNAASQGDAERIRQFIGEFLQQYFTDVQVSLVNPYNQDGSRIPLLDNSTNFLGSLGTALGVSTPIVVAGLVIVGLLYLKR